MSFIDAQSIIGFFQESLFEKYTNTLYLLFNARLSRYSIEYRVHTLETMLLSPCRNSNPKARLGPIFFITSGTWKLPPTRFFCGGSTGRVCIVLDEAIVVGVPSKIPIRPHMIIGDIAFSG